MTTPDALRDCLKTLDLDGNLLSMDADGMCLMEIEDFGTLRGQPWASLWPSGNKSLVAQSVVTARRGKVARFRADCPTAGGTLKNWEVTVSPIRGADGEITALQAISHDVTEREADYRERALVSRELVHRIKNLFAVVDSIVMLSSRSDPQAKVYAGKLRQRLAGLGVAVSYINPMDAAEAASAPRTLKGLISAVLGAFTDESHKVTVEGDDVALDMNQLTAIALILTELSTNAMKYGALKEDTGTVRIVLSRDSDRVSLRWTENGLKLPLKVGPPGFGSTLLDKTASAQLGGAITRTWRPYGLEANLSFDAPFAEAA